MKIGSREAALFCASWEKWRWKKQPRRIGRLKRDHDGAFHHCEGCYVFFKEYGDRGECTIERPMTPTELRDAPGAITTFGTVMGFPVTAIEELSAQNGE